MLTKQDLQNIESHIDKRLEPYFMAIQQDFGTVNQRLDRIEQKTDRLEQRMDRLEQKMDRLEQRMDELPTKDWINSKFEALSLQINANQEKFYKLIEILHEDKKILDRKDIRAIARA